MEVFREEPEFTDIRMVQRVVDMFEGRAQMQRLVRLGLLGMEYSDELDDTGEDDYDIDSWVHNYNHFRGYPRIADMSNDRELSGNHTRSHSSVYQPPLHYWTAQDYIHQPPIKVQAKENDTERRARLLQETKKSKEKAQKKRLKKKRQKERKRLEKLGKEKLNPVKKKEEKGDEQQSQAEGNKGVDEKSKEDTNSSVKELASAEDTESSESSEDESCDEDSDTKDDSGDSEELDMTSTFVRLAKLKLEQKPRPEKKEKKKIPVKEERKSVPDRWFRVNEDQEVEKKDSASNRSPTIEDNIKISTDLGIIGNKFAGSGDYNMAVKYFTDAIKYNPTEFKLFGNRSFCFEKMQEYEKALTDAELCLRLGPGWVKGLFRKGRALAGLKRYAEAAQAFREVLNLDSAYAEAAQELMRVQITQLMEYGFTREQSSNALIIYGTVEKALEVLTKLNPQPGAIQNATFLPAQVANVTGVSPVLSANTSSAPAPLQSKDAPLNKPLGPVQNMSNVQSHPKAVPHQVTMSNSQVNRTPLELFPIWIGNLFHPVSESMLANLFNKVGFVYSVKVLTIKRCAFVNFTKQEHCEEAIRRFHGFELNGMKIAVRYPDRIPHGMGISKSALKADDLQDENMRQNEYGDERNAVGGRRPLRPYRHVPDHRADH